MRTFDSTKSLTNEQIIALDIIKDYSEQFIIDPNSDWPDYYFKKTSYQRWAIEELIERIQNNKYKKPVDIIFEFNLELQKYRENAPNLDSRFIFEEALETTDLIGSLFM